MLAGPMLAAVLMPYGLLLPLWAGVALIAVAIPLLGFVPGKHAGLDSSPNKGTSDIGHEQQALLQDDEAATDFTYTTTRSWQSNSSPVRAFFHEYLNLLKTSSNFRLLLLTKFLASFASSSSSLLALYITLRTGWTFAEVRTTALISSHNKSSF